MFHLRTYASLRQLRQLYRRSLKEARTTNHIRTLSMYVSLFIQSLSIMQATANKLLSQSLHLILCRCCSSHESDYLWRSGEETNLCIRDCENLLSIRNGKPSSGHAS